MLLEGLSLSTKVLGYGSYGLVLKGSMAGSDVAVKFMVTSDKGDNRAIVKELTLAPSPALTHPHICKTYDTRSTVLTDTLFDELESHRERYLQQRRRRRQRLQQQQQLHTPASLHTVLGGSVAGVPTATAGTDAAASAGAGPAGGDGAGCAGPRAGGAGAVDGATGSGVHVSTRARFGGWRDPAGASDAAAKRAKRSRRRGRGRMLHFAPLDPVPAEGAHPGAANPMLPLESSDALCALQEVLYRQGACVDMSVTLVVMEYCCKGTLSRAIYRGIFARCPMWSVRIARRALVRTAAEMARALLHLHNSGVVHGDLKPCNVLLKTSREDRRGFTAKICDFGLCHLLPDGAKSLDSDTWGTPAYMAPEALLGHPSKASDVWSFGVMLSEALTQKPPYGADNVDPARLVLSIIDGSAQLTWPSVERPAAVPGNNNNNSPATVPTGNAADPATAAAPVGGEAAAAADAPGEVGGCTAAAPSNGEAHGGGAATRLAHHYGLVFPATQPNNSLKSIKATIGRGDTVTMLQSTAVSTVVSLDCGCGTAGVGSVAGNVLSIDMGATTAETVGTVDAGVATANNAMLLTNITDQQFGGGNANANGDANGNGNGPNRPAATCLPSTFATTFTNDNLADRRDAPAPAIPRPGDKDEKDEDSEMVLHCLIDLGRRCTHRRPDRRPTFPEILGELIDMEIILKTPRHRAGAAGSGGGSGGSGGSGSATKGCSKEVYDLGTRARERMVVAAAAGATAAAAGGRGNKGAQHVPAAASGAVGEGSSGPKLSVLGREAARAQREQEVSSAAAAGPSAEVLTPQTQRVLEPSRDPRDTQATDVDANTGDPGSKPAPSPKPAARWDAEGLVQSFLEEVSQQLARTAAVIQAAAARTEAEAAAAAAAAAGCRVVGSSSAARQHAPLASSGADVAALAAAVVAASPRPQAQQASPQGAAPQQLQPQPQPAAALQGVRELLSAQSQPQMQPSSQPQPQNQDVLQQLWQSQPQPHPGPLHSLPVSRRHISVSKSRLSQMEACEEAPARNRPAQAAGLALSGAAASAATAPSADLPAAPAAPLQGAVSEPEAVAGGRKPSQAGGVEEPPLAPAPAPQQPQLPQGPQSHPQLMSLVSDLPEAGGGQRLLSFAAVGRDDAMSYGKPVSSDLMSPSSAAAASSIVPSSAATHGSVAEGLETPGAAAAATPVSRAAAAGGGSAAASAALAAAVLTGGLSGQSSRNTRAAIRFVAPLLWAGGGPSHERLLDSQAGLPVTPEVSESVNVVCHSSAMAME